MQRRLERAAPGSVAAAGADRGHPKKLLVKVQHEGPLPAVDRFIGGTERGNALSRWIEQSGMKV